MRFEPFDSMMRIPVSLDCIAHGRPFSIYDSYQMMLMRPRAAQSDETTAFNELLLLGDKQMHNSQDLLAKVQLSRWSLAALQWELYRNYLRNEFKKLRSDAMLRPGARTYLPLLYLRQNITTFRDRLPKARADSLHMALYFIERFKPLSLTPATLHDSLESVSANISRLDGELTSEISIVLGVITVQDSDAKKVQTQRATLLTALAAIYLPLTLVTGIFGMNIKDINDTNPSWRACGIVLAVVAAGTIGFVVAYWQWEVWRRGRQAKERMELGFRKDV
jgi:Mg2+ and Co2+ transporter CorA